MYVFLKLVKLKECTCNFVKGVKQSTQNTFIYDELGEMSYQMRRYLNVIRYWLK